MFPERRDSMNRQPRKLICPDCKGSGKVFKNQSIWEWGWKPCQSCGGTGQIVINPPPKRIRL